MKNDKFVCPICGSTHFDHIISKTTPNWFGIRCAKCIKYIGWLPKELYNAWRNGKIDMDKVEPSKSTKDYIKMLEFFKERGFRFYTYTRLKQFYSVHFSCSIYQNKSSELFILL